MPRWPSRPDGRIARGRPAVGCSRSARWGECVTWLRIRPRPRLWRRSPAAMRCGTRTESSRYDNTATQEGAHAGADPPQPAAGGSRVSTPGREGRPQGAEGEGVMAVQRKRRRSVLPPGAAGLKAPRKKPVDWEGQEQAVVIRWLLGEMMRG